MIALFKYIKNLYSYCVKSTKDWYSSIALIDKYFVFAILIFGSVGIWLPFIIGQEFKLNNLPINLTTYFVSILFAGGFDLILQYIDNDKDSKTKSKVLDIVVILCLSSVLIYYIIKLGLEGNLLLSIPLAFVGTLISFKIWFNSNKDKPTFNEILREEGKNKHGKGWKTRT